jgi:hypothetical protein
MDEVELQERLTRLAERTAPPPREHLAEVVVTRHRTQRRQVVGLTSLVAAVAALVVASTTLIDNGPAAEPAVASGDVASAASGALDTGIVDLSLPTRGSLAAETAFVEGVRQLSWRGPEVSSWGGSDPALDSKHVVFAGEIDGVRLALVAGESSLPPDGGAGPGAPGGVALAWFVGPAGATPAEMVLRTEPQSADSYAAPPALFDQDTGVLVVVGNPGDAISVSRRPEIAADGSVVRQYTPVVDAPAGVGSSVLVDGTTSVQALRYRVVRGSETWTSVPESVGSGDPSTDIPAGQPSGAQPSSAMDALARSDPGSVLDQLGLSAADVDFTVVWAGDVPSPTGSPARVSVLAATLPSGAVFLQCSIAVDLGDGGAAGSWCGSDIRPAGTPLAGQTFVLRIDATDMSGNPDVVSSLVVIAPAGATSARAVDLGGVSLADFPLTSGVAVVPFPERAATVETLAADGSVLQTTRPMTMADLGD